MFVAFLTALTSTAALLLPGEMGGRAVVALPGQSAGMFVSWRMLPIDDDNSTFDVLRDGEVIAANLKRTTSYFDANGTTAHSYAVRWNYEGSEIETYASSTWQNVFTSMKANRPSGGTTKDGQAYTYLPGDCAMADVDADGQLELLLKWNPTNAKDNGAEGHGFTGNVIIDCYKLDFSAIADGQTIPTNQLWRVDLGPNIRAGEHYTQMLFYDLNGDGNAEFVCKTAPGSVDGQGRYVTAAATDEAIKSLDNGADHRNASGRIMSGAELLTVFNGQTGAAVHTVWYNPNRAGQASGVAAYPATDFWGDDYANRSERYLACVAYLGGLDANPSAVFTRGYYTRAYAWAVDFDGSQLSTRWLHRSETPGEGLYGEGSHNISVGDVDGDGRDEIMFGAAALDDDGTLLYRTGLGHGDAIHLADIDPDRPGLEYFMVQEEAPYGWHLRDAKTGEIIVSKTGSADTGMGTAADLDANSRGMEFWSSDRLEMYDCKGTVISPIAFKGVTEGSAANFPHKHGIYWDGDLQQELFYAATVDKWNGKGDVAHVTQFGNYNNSTGTGEGGKPHPLFFGDIMGDWREEVILFSKTDSCTLNFFTTNIPTSYRVPCLLSDHVYEMGLVWQNVGYNMPPHLSYYLPAAVNSGVERETKTYDFTGIGKGAIAKVTWGETVDLDDDYLQLVTAEDRDFDLRFAGNSNWQYRDANATYLGLWAQKAGGKLAILNLKNGDELSIKICKGGSMTVKNPEILDSESSATLGVGTNTLTISTGAGSTCNLILEAGAGTYIPTVTITSDKVSTGITQVSRPSAKSDKWYTLQGVEVSNPARGIYIRNGRKVVVK